MTNKSPQTNFAPWIVVAILWVIAMLNYLDRLMITTMRTSIIADIHMTDAHFVPGSHREIVSSSDVTRSYHSPCISYFCHDECDDYHENHPAPTGD